MKVYIFYKTIEGLEPIFYAHTNSEELKDKFLFQRNKNKFKYNILYMTKSDYNKFKDKYRDFSLSETTFRTKDVSELNKNDGIRIVTTLHEEFDTLIKNDDIIFHLAKLTKPEVAYIFNDEYLKYLNDIKYFELLKFNISEIKEIETRNPIYNGFYGMSSMSIKDKIYSFDEYEVFMTKFKDTMRCNK